ncbi:MAG TPA: guanylate kinase [Lachnospiraceae bacterium]|nr:guanylate kinase [Lachnospiraceae bacterium]
MSRGIITVLSGFAGTGKGTVVRELLKRHSEYALSVSATTRSPREGEQEGVSYFFKTKKEFEEMIRNDQLLEYAQYVDNYYGTPLAYVNEQLEAGKNVLLEIEIQGALQIKEKYPETVLVFLTPPSLEELERRLTGRGTETPEIIRERLKRAAEESRGMEKYDYILVNDDLDTCVEQFHHIIETVRCEASRNSDRITQIQKSLAEKYGN